MHLREPKVGRTTLVSAALGAIGVVWSPTADALTFTVGHKEDSGAGSLRQSVLDANAAAGPDTIEFDAALAGQVVTLTSGPIDIRDSLTVNGPASGKILVQSDNSEADLVTIGGNSISVQLIDLALEGGEDGVQVNAGSNGNSVALTRVRITRQVGDDAVSISGSLNRVILSECTLEGSEDNIAVDGTRNALTLVGTSVMSAKQDGVEVEGDGNVLVIEDSTLSNNGGDPASPNDGIDIDGSGNVVRLTQVTSSGNGEDGIDIEGPGNRVTIEGITVAFNGRDGVKIQDPTGTSTVHVRNSIFAQNRGPDVDGTVTSAGYNLIGNAAGSSGFTGPGDQSGTPNSLIDPKFGALENQGSSTPVHSLGAGSAAIDAGDPSFAPPPEFDQRGPGFPRIVQGRRDIGAFEAGAP